MRRFCPAGAIPWWLGILSCLGTGCAVRGDVSALENELRQSEQRIITLESELRQTQNDLVVAQREADSLRGRLVENNEVVLAPEQADVLFRAEGLRINKLLSGGLDEDSQPGDEQLHLVIEPLDGAGHPLRLPGDLTIEVSDPSAEPASRQLGAWTFTAAQVRDAWHTGLFSSGFTFKLALSDTPRHETLVVHAALVSTDGRQFDATEMVRVAPGSANLAFAPADPPR